MLEDVFEFEKLPGKTHVNSDGSGIGGVDPASYNAWSVPGHEGGLLLNTDGTTQPGQYPAFMWYPATPRPILPNTGKVRFSLDSTLGGAGWNATESDLILVIKGADSLTFKYNLSFQFNHSLRAAQIADKNGNWISVLPNPQLPIVQSGQIWKRLIWSSFDTVGHTWSVEEVELICQEIDFHEVIYVPAGLQNVPASQSNWEVGAYAQLQMSSLPAATPWSWFVQRMRIAWE